MSTHDNLDGSQNSFAEGEKPEQSNREHDFVYTVSENANEPIVIGSRRG